MLEHLHPRLQELGVTPLLVPLRECSGNNCFMLEQLAQSSLEIMGVSHHQKRERKVVTVDKNINILSVGKLSENTFR